jgi:hypothetical protein
MSVEDTVGLDSPIDRALALRDGAASAARAELFSDALRLFGKAHDVLVTEGQHPWLAVGMQVESALISWGMNDRPRALLTLADALDAVELLDPAASRENERAHQFARATIGYFWHKLDPYPSSPQRDIIAIGQASALTGDEALLGIDFKPLSYNWRILALCEIELGIDVGIERRSLAKQTGAGLASIEMFIALARYARVVATGGDFAEAFRLGLLAIWSFRIAMRIRKGEADENEMPPAPAEILRIAVQEGLGEIVKTVAVDLLIWERFCGTWDADFVSRIEGGCAAGWGDAAPIADVISAASSGSYSGTASTEAALAASLAAMADLKGNPRARFQRDLLLVSHTGHSNARRVLEPLVVPIIAEGWSAVLRKPGR